MLNTPVLDVALTLAFTYLIIAIIISSINEWIHSSLIKARPRMLKKAIEEMLFDKEWNTIAEKIIESPFVESLKFNKDSFPAYIPARNFALSLVDIIKDAGKVDILAEASSIRKGIENNDIIKGKAKEVLLTLLDDAAGNIDKFKKNLEQFYNDAMDRVTGWYKLRVKKVLFALAVFSAVIINIDSIQIAKTLWNNPDAAKFSANLAEASIEKIDTAGGRYAIILEDTSMTDISKAKSLLNDLMIPLGWNEGNYPGEPFSDGGWNFILSWFTKLLGLLVTALAASLGAPFWFDLVNKVVNIRGTGRKPEKED